MSEPVLGPGTSSTTLLAQVEAMPWSKRRRISIIGSVVLALLGFGCVMSGVSLYYRHPDSASAAIGNGLHLLGALMLLAAAAAGRIAGNGPLVAGILSGLLGLVSLFSPRTVWSLADVFGIHELSYSVLGYSSVLLPTAGMLLIGAGIAGRWNRDARREATDSSGAGAGPIVEL